MSVTDPCPRRCRPTSAADLALLEAVQVYIRQHGRERARQILQLALLELEDTREPEREHDSA